MNFRWCAFGESRQNIICLDLEFILGDVRFMSRAKIDVFGFKLFPLWCAHFESRKYNIQLSLEHIHAISPRCSLGGSR